MAKITIVIPVYKVGKYIENSIKSVCYQTFTDFEVLLINNNTPDDSIEIAERILKDNQIEFRTLHQPIQGLPAARNMGIAEASGEWIVSIDPDDTISRFFLEELYKSATENNLDVVFSEYEEVKNDTLFIFPEENEKDKLEILDNDLVLKSLLVRKLPLMVSNMFFRKSFFKEHNFKFDETVILGADLILLWKILINIKNIGHLNKRLYNHFCRPDSLMTAPSNEKVATNLAGYKRVCKYVKEHYSKEFSELIYSRAVFAILSTLSTFGTYEIFKYNYNLYYNIDIHKSLNTFPDKRVLILDIILYKSPFMFYYLNKYLRKMI